MRDVPFRREVFAAEKPAGLACIISGLGGTIPEFQKPAETLNAAGYDVAVYEYSEDVLRSGEPEQLPALITGIANDFEDLEDERTRRLYSGASLGSFIGFNLQRRI